VSLTPVVKRNFAVAAAAVTENVVDSISHPHHLRHRTVNKNGSKKVDI